MFFSSRRRHTRYWHDWSSDVCSSDLTSLIENFFGFPDGIGGAERARLAGRQAERFGAELLLPGGVTRLVERRVGKECRFWWSPYHVKKKHRPQLNESVVLHTSVARSY